MASSDRDELPAHLRRTRGNNELSVLPPPASHRSSLLAMGQGYSKPPSHHVPHGSGSSLIAQRGLAAAAATGVKLKRAFGGGRNKKAAKVAVVEEHRQERRTPPPTTASIPVPHLPRSSVESQQSSHSPSGSKLSLRIFGGRRSTSSASPDPTPIAESIPPPVPPKPSVIPATSTPSLAAPKPREQRSSLITMSPAISHAVSYSLSLDEGKDHAAVLHEMPSKEKEHATDDKENWRKSDSTIGHSTIRPGAASQPRASRPVSMADSVQSAHTILGNKRMSALIDDADWAMPEEDDLSMEELVMVTAQSSPTPSVRAMHRRSVSVMTHGTQPRISLIPSPSDSAVNDLRPIQSRGYSDVHTNSSSHDGPMLTTAPANGFIAPSSPGSEPAGAHIRGKLAAFHSPKKQQMHQPPLPPPSPSPSTSSTSFRQTAISMSNGFAPAAGLAKRAVERMGKWGGFSSPSSSPSGYASSSSNSSTGPPTAWAEHGLNLRRLSSGHRSPFYQSSSSKGKNRRTPDAPSGAWSVNSSVTSGSDSETPVGPDLGLMVRSPLRQKGGVVFGKDLRSVVRHTALKMDIAGDPTDKVTRNNLVPLEARRLPAVVVRCAQHILTWGIQEEGLFRVSGRPAHVTKLRTEFDTGADYDMRDCSPGEIDPHAVAGVFKAFLRELPEPVLTHTMLPYFEEALSQEANATSAQASSTAPRRLGGLVGLPSNPRDSNLRKPPSLSTLQMPNFSGAHPPSKSLRNALRALVHQLPLENRHLLRTITELINATAIEQKSTKMPLNNLYLIFCPSLSMNPPMLRVLCEIDEIWNDDPGTPLIDIPTPEDAVMDISMRSDAGELDSERYEDSENASIASSRPSLDSSAGSRPSYESVDGKPQTRIRPLGPRRAHAPAALFVDSIATKEKQNTYSTSPPPLSSSESLTSTSDSSAVMSLEPQDNKADFTRSVYASLTDSSDQSPRPSGKPYISAPIPVASGIQFPTFEDTSPRSTLSSKRSMPSLSTGSLLHDSPVNSASPRKRVKRPSLHLLFSKRSAPTLNSQSDTKPVISTPIAQTSRPIASSSPTTPISRTSSFLLDTPIDSSSLGLEGRSPESSPEPPTISLPASAPASQFFSASSRFPVDEDELDRQIASRATMPPTATIATAGTSHLRVRPTRRGHQTSASTASSYLGLMDEEEGEKEDWTRSVLLAADPNGWSLSMT